MNDTNNTNTGFVQRLRESPRTVSAIIIILIVAAAIYAFSSRQEPQTTDVAQVTETTEQTADPEVTPSPGEETPATTTSNPGSTTPAPVTPLPEPSRTDSGFTEVAQSGEGITHLARKATDRWLQENQAGYNVTAEHRVYIEDYIQNQIGSEGLKLGETRTVSYDLISEAVNSAKTLSDAQLKNLSLYTPG